MTLKCMSGHKFSQKSEPMLGRMAAGNLLLSSFILLSGCTYTKVASLANILSLKFFSENPFYTIKNIYICSVINEFWQKEQNSVFSKLEGTTLKL